ncbi:glycoside hydrolase family 5 protein [Flavobacterium sp. ASW18X]|uniref:glycoside hydrolase family 5 protein n=1 Tax=Flavobacterium sp. ASW18X TaxID=2572595 RepID=UPI0010AE0B0A|nr:glycoside hydrolase family 5 protein [Flavobacterium sp. ASW18X]TKD63407.1 glycoside hydrolase family 5 protein [Flavobacterium sp. ASW18X]
MRNYIVVALSVVFFFSCSSDSVEVVTVPNMESTEEPVDNTNDGGSNSDNSNDNSDNTSQEVDVTVYGDDLESDGSDFDNGVMRGLTPIQFAAEMKTGWNLGNSLDAEGPDETFWGNPRITKEMVDAVANRGFTTLRLPVTWRFHQGDAPNYAVEIAWLDRVEEVVNYARANDMYVIVNVHHDDPWIIPTQAESDGVKDRLAKLWTQIAVRFRDYSDYVIFETLNEPRHENTPEEWSGGTVEGRDMVNAYHQVSLDAIRATGGNNETRKIMISTYAASTVPVAMDALIIPNNDPNTMVSLHSYFPFPFTLEGTDTTWGSSQDRADLLAEMNRIKTRFSDRGMAVVLGEWSSANQNNIEDRLAHAEYYSQLAAERGFASIWWDNGDTSANRDGLAIFDRDNMTFTFDNIADILIRANE